MRNCFSIVKIELSLIFKRMDYQFFSFFFENLSIFFLFHHYFPGKKILGLKLDIVSENSEESAKVAEEIKNAIKMEDKNRVFLEKEIQTVISSCYNCAFSQKTKKNHVSAVSWLKEALDFCDLWSTTTNQQQDSESSSFLLFLLNFSFKFLKEFEKKLKKKPQGSRF